MKGIFTFFVHLQDAWLLKAATEECRQRFGSSFGVLAR